MTHGPEHFRIPDPHTHGWWRDENGHASVRVLAGHYDLDAFAVALSEQWREAVLGFHRFG